MSIPIGMVGGGQGAFIGAVHRCALRLDGLFRLSAGCFSRDIENTRSTGAELGLHPARCYGTYREMLDGELRLPQGDRIRAVAIVAPNRIRREPAELFLRAGIHVICDKPMATTLEDGEAIARAARESGAIFALTHNYTGYPLVREARELVRGGALGSVRKIFAEYLQGWLASNLEASGHKQASWRTDPETAGPAGALMDIGTHAFNLVEHVAGSPVARVFARLDSVVPGRRLDDDGVVLTEFADGSTGTLVASQVCFGKENALSLRIFGTKGALEWNQERPDDLWWTDESGQIRRVRAATKPTGAAARSLTRLPPGHPEGYIEGFANVYRAFARAIAGEPDIEAPFPGAEEGLRALRFVDACLRSARAGAWTALPDPASAAE